jgi:hypothetical protein
MDAADYDRYLKAFNARDYATLETFFADDFALETGGFLVKGKPAFRKFYAFLHSYFKETVSLNHFFPGERAAAANVTIRFEGMKDLTQEILTEAGYPQMTPVPKGASVDVHFLIVYEQRADGLIQRIKGAVFIPAAAS